jgi:hypothetical protein
MTTEQTPARAVRATVAYEVTQVLTCRNETFLHLNVRKSPCPIWETLGVLYWRMKASPRVEVTYVYRPCMYDHFFTWWQIFGDNDYVLLDCDAV